MIKTVQQALVLLNQAFQAKQVEHSMRQSEDLLADLLNWTRAELYLNAERRLTAEQWGKCQFWLAKRLQGMPLQYLHGKVEFFDTLLHVNSHVLIPRQETEILVDKIAQFLKNEALENKVLWDLCCGSGCISIALKKKFPALQVLASDLSKEAVNVAKKNAQENQVEVFLKQGDLMQAFKNCKVNYFVCNPPYISLKEYEQLEKDVVDYEPRQALLAGETGLEFYVCLAEQLPDYLLPFAKIWLEIGYNQGQDVRQLFEGPYWENQKIEKDWAGHDRFFSCQLKG